MWLFTVDGFFSVVSKGCRPDQLMVRARVRADLARAFPKSKITTSQSTDYRYRTIVTRKALVALLARTVEKLDYANFKDTVKDGARHEAYLRVWNAMYALQERPARKVPTIMPAPRRKLDAGVQVDDLRWFGAEYDD
jgi:hypothetical protein